MPDKVNLNEEKRIIEVYSSGEVVYDEMVESIKKIEMISEKTGINKVLIDTGEMTSLPPSSDIYDLAEIFPRTLKIAVYILKDSPIKENLNFGITVALNRGILISLFESKDEAEKWLLR